MSEITVPDLISGIVAALIAEFGEGYEVFTETVEQGLSEPCFCVLAKDPEVRRVMGRRYFRKNPFVIQYYAGSSVPKAEAWQVAERLTDCLEYIRAAGELFAGSARRAELADGTMSFYVSYDFYVIKAAATVETMNDLTTHAEVKG